MRAATARRWSKRAQVLAVVAVVLAATVLTLGTVGFARSVGFWTRIGVASEALNEVGQISPDVTVGAGTSVTPVGGSESAPATPPAAIRSATTSPPPGGGAPSSPAAALGEAAGTGGVAGAGGAAGASGVGGEGGVGGVGGAGGASGAGGLGGASGAAPSYWDGVLQTMLTLLGPSTTQMCGPNTCNVGQVCCNPSCGTCVAPGATCDQAACAGAARTPSAVRCGTAQCNDGQVCCNPSCGICAAPGETCSTDTCG